MINKILIANRGEIACRIIKACNEINIKTVAVYSEIEKNALHVQKADDAVCIGPAPAIQSYLNINAIIKAAKEKKCDAIHPGYGFLSENHEFSKRCMDENLIFIGPNHTSMKLLGNKVDSRIALKDIVPLVPGMRESSKDISKFKKVAEEIGFPVLIKAAAGGGGKGMRIVRDNSEIESAVESAMRESFSAFGSVEVYLEKFIESPRHIELQVAADNYGNVIHLFERECSIQRRHQKIIEESPSVVLDETLRKKMGEVAVNVIKTAKYNNLGTVEFLVDKDKNFYFLEVNARLQVEHPVTEMDTGIDLVKLQIQIANGEKLPLDQSKIIQRGHSIECRIYAEDPENNFLPSSGKILFLKEPTGPGVRYDSGIYQGCEVSVFYDPILAKLITYGSNREDARKKMLLALKENIILGVKTPISFLIEILEHPEFINGNLSTDFIQKNISEYNCNNNEMKNLGFLLTAHYLNQKKSKSYSTDVIENVTPWNTIGNWEIGKEIK